MFRNGSADLQAALEAIPRRQSWLERVAKKRIIVHTRDDQSIEGVLMEQTEDGLILRAAKLLGENSSTSMAGEVWIPQASVAFAQLDE